MSPKRQSPRISSAPSPKPYAKSPVIGSDIQESAGPAQQELHISAPTGNSTGFPSHTQYKLIEENYLRSLTPRRQSKALISQALFDRIWDVLQCPDTQKETAQFRFWVRKMFTLGKAGSVGSDGLPGTDPSQTVLMHEKLIVATQEQIYDLLCYAHGKTNHGGRDKTCALLRTHYTWVPKELVAKFIKACHTCMAKKCGSADFALVPSRQENANAEETSALPAPAYLGSLAGGEGTSNEEDVYGMRRAMAESADKAARQQSTVPFPSMPIGGIPMSREVSLYYGLPNGWQFHTDYATAYKTFVERKQDTELPPAPRPHEVRPRVPSIAPLLPIDAFKPGDMQGERCLSENLTDKALEGEGDSVPQIDPALLAISVRERFAKTMGEPASQSSRLGNASNDANASAIYRVGAPKTIDLGSRSSYEAMEAFMVFRDAADLTPDSPHAEWSPGSPTSSLSATASPLMQFSPFASATTTANTSPAESALATPVDDAHNAETDFTAKKLADAAPGEELRGRIENLFTMA